ncbi:hypothetical protein BURC_02254 [Burkholderiaceae bacterium]|nr:hypothetical protein BURC_02254 [Burkholderiaceae bacterium]
MEKLLHLLESFTARGSDGKTYFVHGYEHLVRVDVLPSPQGQWEPTGQAEYKLADGRCVEVDHQGVMRVAGTEVTLEREREGAATH